MLDWLVSLFSGLFTNKPAPPGPLPKRSPSKRAAAATAGSIALAMPLVAAFEGYSPRVYRDEVGVKTVCYGQTATDGANFGKVYTKAECLKMLGDDLAKYQAQIRKCVPQVQPLHREAALISFAYNLGPRALCGSVGRNINAGNIEAGCHAMLQYVYAGGKVLPGLTRRRQAEEKMCLRDD